MQTIYILAYKGRMIIDRLIHWYEWGKYSHIILTYNIDIFI